MAGKEMKRVRVAATILACVGFVLTALPSQASGQGIPSYAESTSDALARNVRILADNPKNFTALLGAGKAALDLGDAQSAAGFFGRAEEVNPNSPLAQAGMAAALVASGDPTTALTYFARAQQLGAAPSSIGSDRGLAFDLLGQQATAQQDYRAALLGPDRDEARRRLSLSLAISGNKAEALEALQPLLVRGDTAARRVRALVLAVTGDITGAKAALDSTIPGASHSMDPFFRRLAVLTTAQKAAAVHLGIFPDSGVAIASRSPVPAPSGDRLASIDQFLATPQPQARAAPPQIASAVPRAVTPSPRASVPAARGVTGSQPTAAFRTAEVQTQKRVWLQLASGSNATALPDQFDRIRARKPALFEGISGYVANDNSRSRLLIGPFRSSQEAQVFADALSNARIDAFSWTSPAGLSVYQIAE